MGLQLAKDSIDLGIVVTDAERSLAFYRDLLGFEVIDVLPMPGHTTMHRLSCGTSVVKLLELGPKATPVAAAPGGINGAFGYRYFTMTITNLEEIVAACIAGGHTIAVPVTALRPGISIAIVEDPDGNWVEFVQVG